MAQRLHPQDPRKTPVLAHTPENAWSLSFAAMSQCLQTLQYTSSGQRVSSRADKPLCVHCLCRGHVQCWLAGSTEVWIVFSLCHCPSEWSSLKCICWLHSEKNADSDSICLWLMLTLCQELRRESLTALRCETADCPAKLH